jgi:chromosome segregation protein
MERCRVDLAADHERCLPQDSFNLQSAKDRLTRLRNRLGRMGPVNMEAINEHDAVSKRHAFLTEQFEDLNSSLEDLRAAIRKINRTSRGKFLETLEAVNKSLETIFPVLFGGGQARLELEGSDDPLEAGLNIVVQLPGKKIRHLESMSGGEKTMTAVAVLFALFLIKPAPFCLLDEVDAPLDETNIGRFHNLLEKLSEHSQILMVTHNRRTMEIVNMLYGVTMEQKGISKILAVSLSQGEAMAA